MVIETYLDVEEHIQSPEEIMEYNKIASELGLNELIIKDGSDHKPSPMNVYEMNVYKTLCPREIELKDYKHLIPKRVLDALAKCKGYLDSSFPEVKFFVWIDEKPDPILVAKIDWNKFIMIGRWGAELDSFPILEKRAIEKAKENFHETVMKMKLITKMYDENPDNLAKMKLTNNIPYTGSL